MHQEPICLGSFWQRGSCFLIIKPLNVCVGILVVQSKFLWLLFVPMSARKLEFLQRINPLNEIYHQVKGSLELTTGKFPSHCRHIILVVWLILCDTFHIPFTGSYHFQTHSWTAQREDRCSYCTCFLVHAEAYTLEKICGNIKFFCNEEELQTIGFLLLNLQCVSLMVTRHSVIMMSPGIAFLKQCSVGGAAMQEICFKWCKFSLASTNSVDLHEICTFSWSFALVNYLLVHS
jgi:hypothetical protein